MDDEKVITSLDDVTRGMGEIAEAATAASFQLLGACPDTKVVQDASFVIIRGVAGGLAAILYAKRHGRLTKAEDLEPGQLNRLVNELLLGAFVKP